MAPPKPGDRLFIARGTYKGKHATYVGKYRVLMCRVKIKIDGDSIIRNVRMTSIRPMPAKPEEEQDNEDHCGAESEEKKKKQRQGILI